MAVAAAAHKSFVPSLSPSSASWWKWWNSQTLPAVLAIKWAKSGDLKGRKPVELVLSEDFKWSARSLSTTSHWSSCLKTSSHVPPSWAIRRCCLRAWCGLCRWFRPDYLQLDVSSIRLRRLRIVWLRLSLVFASVCPVCLSCLRLSVRLRLSGLPRSSDLPPRYSVPLLKLKSHICAAFSTFAYMYAWGLRRQLS